MFWSNGSRFPCTQFNIDLHHLASFANSTIRIKIYVIAFVANISIDRLGLSMNPLIL